MKNVEYFFAAYGIVWAAVGLYAFWLGARLKALETALRDGRPRAE